jgi:uncharacterized protein YggT (Ycf19 family)
MALPPENNPPPGPPPDHEHYVEEVRGPNDYYQREVSRSPATDRFYTISRVNQVIWLFFVFVVALIGLRVILRLIGANPAAVFTQFVYGASQIFLWPFTGITPDPGMGAFTLEISSIIAMIVYLLIGWGVTKMVWVLFYRTGTQSETVYRRERH